MAWWKRSQRGPTAAEAKKPVPKGVWAKCPSCGEILVEEDVAENLQVCPACDHHMSINARRRIELLVDPNTFEELAGELEPVDPLGFKDSKKYKDRLKSARKKADLSEAALVGLGYLDGRRVALGVLAFEYLGGSMGSVVGERVTRLFEAALEQRCPAILCAASGGARMQEGILSLMQMAKTSAARARLREARLPYLSVLLHPTTGGVAASFAMLGDITLAEPGALVGFAGPRVIEQTIRQRLPEGFQRSEFLLEHGMVDAIVHRRELRARLSFFIELLGAGRTG